MPSWAQLREPQARAVADRSLVEFVHGVPLHDDPGSRGPDARNPPSIGAALQDISMLVAEDPCNGCCQFQPYGSGGRPGGTTQGDSCPWTSR